ncbi:MAG: hypothetical protein AB7S26_38275 [Sandaracinaceae bacterium]
MSEGSSGGNGAAIEAVSDDDAGGEGPLALHRSLRERFEKERARHDAVDARYGLVVLGLAGVTVVLLGTGLFGGSLEMLGGGVGALVAFFVVRMFQSRTIKARAAAEVRRDIHDRHVKRMCGRLADLPPPAVMIPPGHPYASDLDLSGPSSILQRIDTTHTAAGAKGLASWLSNPASREEIERRQTAVLELAPNVELRQELEGAALDSGRDRLNADPFVEMMGQKGVHEQMPWLRFVAPTLPIATVTLVYLASTGMVPLWIPAIPLLIQGAIVRQTEPMSRAIYEAFGARRGFAEAFAQLFRVVEGASFTSPLLGDLKKKLEIDGSVPSQQMKRLERWMSFYELRESGLGHIVLNPLLLWDLNCLMGIEAWIKKVGRKSGRWFATLGEIEALASLSVLKHQELESTMPTIVDAEDGLTAKGIAHPLIPADTRVSNDLTLDGPGTCVIVTGSNMAGKSTLLRAVGVNVALALAGGPVLAREMSVPRVRIRASMRIADSLQSGASYFQAELGRLRLVVHRAEESPPILFLLDELLRGTNARARHIGARAVVQHLLDRGAMGIVATHDIALSKLEDERPEQVHNVHFTDVIEDGVMTFDYHLREGVVKTSNALRLLAEVGIEVVDDGRLEDGVAPAPQAIRQ